MLSRILEYTLVIAINIAYVVIVFFVLNRLEGHREQLIIAVLGLMYVSMRWAFIGQTRTLIDLASGLNAQFVKIRELLNDETLAKHNQKVQKAIHEAGHFVTKSQIDGFFLFLIGVMCLVTIWAAL